MYTAVVSHTAVIIPCDDFLLREGSAPTVLNAVVVNVPRHGGLCHVDVDASHR